MSAMPIPNLSSSSAASAVGGRSDNRSINIVGSGGADFDAINRLVAISQGPSANGGFTSDSTYDTILNRTTPMQQWMPYIVIGGVVILAVYLMRD